VHNSPDAPGRPSVPDHPAAPPPPQFGDPALARASDAILAKVAAVVPPDLEPLLAGTKLFVPTIVGGKGSADGLAIVREALVSRRRLTARKR
jgi:hypothetical protein